MAEPPRLAERPARPSMAGRSPMRECPPDTRKRIDSPHHLFANAPNFFSSASLALRSGDGSATVMSGLANAGDALAPGARFRPQRRKIGIDQDAVDQLFAPRDPGIADLVAAAGVDEVGNDVVDR